MVRELRGASAAVSIAYADAVATRALELLAQRVPLGEAIRVLQRELGLSGSEARRALTGARAHEPEVRVR